VEALGATAVLAHLSSQTTQAFGLQEAFAHASIDVIPREDLVEGALAGGIEVGIQALLGEGLPP